MTRIGSYLTTAARWLRGMQLPTGELPAVQWSDSGDAYHAPAPLLSALAYDALAHLDPRSPRFAGRVRDLVPSSFFRTIVSIRWGLRLSIAAEEDADGTWQLHGRSGAREADVATTACGAVALLPNVRWRAARFDRRHMESLRRLASRGEWTPLETAHATRYLSLAGADTRALAMRVRRDLESTPMTPAYAHAVARAIGEMPQPAPRIEGRLAQALATSALLEVQQEGPELDDALNRILFDTTPPWLWPADPYDDRRLGSPAAGLAINLSNVARLAAVPRGEDR